jgi:hypothetical protein
VFLDELCQVTVVPTFTQNGALPLASGMLGVAVAKLLPLRFTFTTQGVELEPQAVLALHMLPGFDSEQTYLLVLSPLNPLADMCVAITTNANTIKAQQIATYPRSFITHLQEKMTSYKRVPVTSKSYRDPISS